MVNGTTRNKWDSMIPLEPLWEQYERIIKDNGAIVLTAQTPFDKILGVSNLKLLRYEWIWDKQVGTGFLNAKRMPLKSHENILVFYKKQPTYNPQMTDAKPENIRPLTVSEQTSSNYGKVEKLRADINYDLTKRYPVTVLPFNKNEKELNSTKRLHPTQKPVALFEYLIKTYTNEGEVVLDNCIGSGTTAVAAINTNRQFIGIEREAKYVEIANKRIAEALERKTGGTSEISKG